ncbi:MAG: hypothetical protein IJ047_06965 [Paludibacteraceae bacterium]|nr:hypothetical protein [Paludibacteraceae bacterium]
MKVRNSVLVALCLLFLPVFIQAKERGERVVWASKANSRTGLYTTKNFFVSQGISIGVNAMYYFGDVDNEGLAFHGGFNKENLSYGGGLNFGYNIPAGNHCNLRVGLMAGTLRGNNKEKFDNLPEPRDDYRKFQSVLIHPSFGVQYYPFANAGFYLYGGVAVAASIITNYEFYAYRKQLGSAERVRTKLEGKTFGILPMVQLGIGYSWRLAPSWSMSAEIMVQEGLIDTHYMNLDAFPLAPSQSSDGQQLGNSFGKWTDRYGNEHIHWNDGWFQVGITVTYQWRNCENCRILNNYSGIKGRRR